jgi:hypothetical protein
VQKLIIARETLKSPLPLRERGRGEG